MTTECWLAYRSCVSSSGRAIKFTNGDGAGVRINYAKAAEFAR
jgi:hypothetical protein